MEKVLKTVEILFWTIIVALFLWFGASYIDVIVHQFSGGTESTWNLFNILLNIKA